MKSLLINLSVKLQILKDKLKEENGQDLIEYALVVSIIALGATTSMRSVSSDISTVFTHITTTLTTSIT